MAMEAISESSLRGARKIVSTCLGLLPGHELLIFADETTLDAARLIHQAAVDQQVHSTILFVSMEDQVRYAKGKEMPLTTQAAMKDAKAILTCVSDQPETMNFRATIIRAKDYQIKIGNCPGINMEMLSTVVDVDYSAMTGLCHLLAVALVKGGKVDITTEDRWGKEHVLHLSLGNWENVPVTSTGVIEEGVWGNIPSGETFVAPLEDSAEGEIIINGSLPGYVFPENQEIKLTFKSGMLVHIDPDTDWGAQLLQAKLSAAQAAGDQNCERLAELGIGVNPKVVKLTGKPLIDEKKAGTIHVALGNNMDFGGRIKSTVHLDLVTRAFRVTVNDQVIQHHGELVIQESTWRGGYKEIALPADWADTIEAVSRTGNKTNPRSPRLLQLELLDGSGRTLHVSVGDNPTAKLAATIYSKIPYIGAISLSALLESTALDKDDLLKVLKVMQDYQLVKLHKKSNHAEAGLA